VRRQRRGLAFLQEETDEHEAAKHSEDNAEPARQARHEADAGLEHGHLGCFGL